MKTEYDFTHGERGKFYHKNAVMNVPVYLDKRSMGFVSDLARKRKADISKVVNELIHADMRRARIGDSS